MISACPPDRLPQKVFEDKLIVQREGALEALPQHFEILLRQQADRNNLPGLGHSIS